MGIGSIAGAYVLYSDAEYYIVVTEEEISLKNLVMLYITRRLMKLIALRERGKSKVNYINIKLLDNRKRANSNN